MTRSDPAPGQREAAARTYWQATLRLMAILLAIWFSVSFGFGILLRDTLDRVSIGGAPLGFWFAQQGSILTFVVLIFVYAWAMNRLERRYRREAGQPAEREGEPEGEA